VRTEEKCGATAGPTGASVSSRDSRKSFVNGPAEGIPCAHCAESLARFMACSFQWPNSPFGLGQRPLALRDTPFAKRAPQRFSKVRSRDTLTRLD